MAVLPVNDANEARKIIEQRKLTHIKVGVFDIDGVLRGKYMSTQKFIHALNDGFGFCDVILGWDANDELYENSAYTGWHSGYPDAKVKIIASSCREIPFEPDTLFFLGEFSGNAEMICSRALLRRVCQKARDMGLQIYSGFEYEFFVFNESPQSIKDKNYHNLQAFNVGNFGYSVIRNSVESDLYRSILDLAETMNFPIEGLHEETGPGVLEAALVYCEAELSADNAALFKTFSKILLQKQHQKMATFMAKWSPDFPGQSGHIHLSIKNDKGESLFYDSNNKNGISELMSQFVAGCQSHLPEFLALVAPTINSYKRLVPGLWAPTHASVGIDNRTCAIRIIPGDQHSQRLEYRIGAADANPYIILSALIASGLSGIEDKIELKSLVTGNAYQTKLPNKFKLPNTLSDATQRLKNSDKAKFLFGEAFIQHYVASREWEVQQYQKHISEWELQRYFEII